MPNTTTIQLLDRLAVKSALRGSTSSICGLLGTLTLIILCMAIYIPPTVGYFRGDYFETEFYNQNKINQTYVSNQDFKIAIQFRYKQNNTVADHKALLSWAYSDFLQVLTDTYVEPASECRRDYFADTINPVELEDCFVFPEDAIFPIFWDYSYAEYNTLFYWLYPQASDNPFEGIYGSPQLMGYEYLMNRLLSEHYFIVYFTSRMIDGRTGQPYFQVNRYYSTDSNYNTLGSSSWDLLAWNAKTTNMDISIMPWLNNITRNTLTWLGKSKTVSVFDPINAASQGIEVYFSLDNYNIVSYRYYKKLDWLFGIIGGAMLLFYLILWVPCNYIARTLHQINNVRQLLLISIAEDGQSPTRQNVFPAVPSKWYWVSNPILNFFSSACQKASNLVKAGEQEIDIVSLVKKLKVVERTLKKKELLGSFKPKILKMKSITANVVLDESEEVSSYAANEEGSRRLEPRTQVIEQVVEEDFIQLPVEETFGLTEQQISAVEIINRSNSVYENSLTANIIADDQSQITALEEMHKKSRYRAEYDSNRKVGRLKKFFNSVVKIIRLFDFFGAKPNLIAEPYNSSVVGCCGMLIILALSILTVALTVKNAGNTELMILNEIKSPQEVAYTLKTGTSLKFALCFSKASNLKGSSRTANLRFFTETKDNGRRYYTPTPLTSADYGLFDLTSDTAPINLDYCFTMPQNIDVLMATKPQNQGYFGFRVEPYCSSTASTCLAQRSTINRRFLTFINSTQTDLMLPENRFDPNQTKFINNLIDSPLNINLRYMANTSSMQETYLIDHVQILDDTRNWFIRKSPITLSQGISSNQNTPFPTSRNFPSGGNPYYEVKIKPSNFQTNYVLTSKKADTVLGIIGGVFVLWYALFHWVGKWYNSFNIKAKLAEDIYYQETINESLLKKCLAILPIPSCLLPSCCNIGTDVIRMRQIDKKLLNDLNYLWLVKHVDTLFQLSSALFNRIQAKNLSLVYVKEKVDESQLVLAPVEAPQSLQPLEFINIEDFDDIHDKKQLLRESSSKILNESILPQKSQEKLIDEKEPLQPSVDQNGTTEQFNDNYIHGLAKQSRLSWLDIFEYNSSLTFKGVREVTSCCGGCCCLLLLALIIIVASFEVGIYLNRSDIRIGMTTQFMQPLMTQSNSSFNSQIHLISGQNFKLAVTFSSAYEDYPHSVANWTNSAVGISVYQEIYTYDAGSITAQMVETPMAPCPSNYLTSWLNPLVDPVYYQNAELGYCLPDGITLEIDGIPQDKITKRFTLSIYNKAKTDAGNLQVKQFMQLYLPKIHVSNAIPDFNNHQFKYQISSFTFDAFNITTRTSQNISLSKTAIVYDDQIAFEGDPYTDVSYYVFPFQQFQTIYTDTSTNYFMSYNISYANSYQVQYYTVKGEKFYSTFGIIGGLVALLIFGLGCCARSFNDYRMRYLIGRQLYLFDLVKAKQARAVARGRKRKTKQELLALSQANKMSEAEVLLAYVLSYVAVLLGNYNINNTLRRVTLIQRKVEKDLDIYEVYKKVHNMRDIIKKQLPSRQLPITDIHLKRVYQPQPQQNSLIDRPRIVSFAKKHNWSCFQQFAVYEAAMVNLNLKQVFDNAFLQKALNIMNDDRSQAPFNQFGGTQGSLGTNSIGEPSDFNRESQGMEEEHEERLDM